MQLEISLENEVNMEIKRCIIKSLNKDDYEDVKKVYNFMLFD